MKFLFEERTRPGNVVPARGVYANGAHEQCGLSGTNYHDNSSKDKSVQRTGTVLYVCVQTKEYEEIPRIVEIKSAPHSEGGDDGISFRQTFFRSFSGWINSFRHDWQPRGFFFSFHDIRRNRNDISIVFTRKQLEKSQISPFREMTSNLKQNKKKSAAIVSLSVCYPRFFFRRCWKITRKKYFESSRWSNEKKFTSYLVNLLAPVISLCHDNCCSSPSQQALHSIRVCLRNTRTGYFQPGDGPAIKKDEYTIVSPLICKLGESPSSYF